MKEFIVENYKEIVLAFACLLDVILFLCGVFRKKSQAPLDVVLEAAPYYIKFAEEHYATGEEKKSFVMDYLCKTYKKLCGVELTQASNVYQTLEKFVERILETPQKKGKKNEK